MPSLRAVSRDDRPFYSVKALAVKLSVSEHTIRNMMDRGEIPWYRIGAQRRVDPADLDRWLNQRRERR